MTLMDAPKFDVRRERRNRTLLITGVVVIALAAIAVGSWAVEVPWQLWHWPADHRVNNFFAAVQSGDMQKAYGIWNNDPNWQQHPTSTSPTASDEFDKDWGPASDYGTIKSHKIVIAHHVGNGVVMGVNINGGKSPSSSASTNKDHRFLARGALLGP